MRERLPFAAPPETGRLNQMAAVLRHLAIASLVALSAVPQAAKAQDWQAGTGAEWQRVLADAKKEGHVAVVGPSELALPIADAFQKDTGIQVDFLGGVASVNA